MKNNTAYTIVSKNYLGQALTACKSFKAQNNENYDFKIFLMDLISSNEDIEMIKKIRSEGFDISFWSDVRTTIPNVDYENMLFKYDVIEMNTAIKPYVMEHLYILGYQKVIYFDPDIYFYQPINEIDKKLDEYEIVLTPHMLEPFPEDGYRQNNLDILRAGIYNCGFIATSKGENSNKMIKFWQRQLFNYSFVKIDEGMFTDQIWAQWFPVLFDKVYILKDKGHNGAYWNLHERLPEFKDGKWYLGGDLLVFYHFSGFDPNNINVSKYQTRYDLSDLPDEYRKFSYEYSKELLGSNYNDYKSCEYYYNTLYAEGLKINKTKHRRFIYELINNPDSNPFLYDKNNKIHFNWRKGILKAALVLFRYLRKAEEPSNFGLNIVCDVESDNVFGDLARKFIDKIYVAAIPYTIESLSKTNEKEIKPDFRRYSKYYATKSLFNKNVIIADVQKIPEILAGKPKTDYNVVILVSEDDKRNFKKLGVSVNEIILFNEETSVDDIYNMQLN